MSKRTVVAATLTTWALALFSSLATYTFSDDHFGRISPARQIARYGELPFRDFFDPGYFLTELSSAAVQRLFGDNLMGEMLLTSSSVAAGAVAILLLVRRATGSLWLGVATAAVAVLASPRPYDYDKFFFYPFGLLVCWRYADTRSPGRLLVIAVAAVVAGMFRYDNGLFVAVSGLVALAAVHSGDMALLVRRSSLFIGACVACAAPYALFLQLNGGLINALDQMATYARREAARTNIGTLPSGVFSDSQVTPLPPQPPDRVQIRWTPESDGTRAALESRYSLHDGVQHGDPSDRIWLYEIDDASRANLRALVADPGVADTHMIDRERMTLMPQETRWLRLWRRLRIVGVTSSISWSVAGAAAALYYLFVAVALGALVTAMRSTGVDREGERARIVSAAVMTLLAVALVLRAPIVARIGGAIGPPAVLGAWMWHRFSRLRFARAAIALGVLATLAVAADWSWSLPRIADGVGNIRRALATASIDPPPTTSMPNPKLGGLVGYLRRCTRPDDRLFMAWFQPDVYFFSQRGFAGGMVVVFGDHWSDVEYQRRIIDTLATQSVPVFILRNEAHADFRPTYRVIDEYLRSQFQDAGSTSFGDDGNVYTVLTRRDRTPTGIDAMTSMPCFARSA